MLRIERLTTRFNQIQTSWRRARTERWGEIEEQAAPGDGRRLMCVLAHPDDEALCVGGTLAKYAAEGVAIALVVATRGERGWRGTEAENPGLKRVGELREAELRRAAKLLGVKDVRFLDYVDGELDAADPPQVIGEIAREMRRFRPQVVITFDPQGMYGHPDHVAIAQAAMAATVSAADASFEAGGGLGVHCVSKLYYRVYREEALQAYQEIFGTLRMVIDGVAREAVSWQGWAVSARIDTTRWSESVLEAIARHRTQVPKDAEWKGRYRAAVKGPLAAEEYFRAFSLVNGGRAVEQDLFEGVEMAMKTGRGEARARVSF